ncbi:MAG: T9SS type A sorting domain-containing protein, partial [Thermoanaerobaculia bacterium]|nr:T9SS type A sorting domain-containing protein [Thermoanaerobaculia bacterium]
VLKVSMGNVRLENLSGLENLKLVTWFKIVGNNSLTSLKGLDNLEKLFSLVIDDNDSLQNLSGVEKITTTGHLAINNNKALKNLSGLDNLKSIGGHLEILNNISLTSLSGLNHLDYTSIDTLNIQDCPVLSTCAVQPICAYLQNDGPATIFNNAPGCNSVPEVEAACIVFLEETPGGKRVLHISPNPATDFLQIQISDNEKWDISLFDLQGRLLYRQAVSGNQSIDVADWPAGLYALLAVSGGRVYAGRFVKQ